MKLKSIFATLIGGLLLLSSCKDDIVIAKLGEETAVVYGVLNPAEHIHYVKINRAFISNDNSLEIAKIADSNYFQNVAATVKEYNGAVLTRTWVLEDTIIENKESGIFYFPNQKIYKFSTTSSAPLIPGRKYVLDISINNGEFFISGETPLVTGMNITSPTSYSSYAFASANVATTGYATPLIASSKGTAVFAELKMLVVFEEFRGTDVTEKSFEWNLGTRSYDELLSASNIATNASGKAFYELVKKNVTNDPSITKRRLKYTTLSITGGSDVLNEYININKPSNSLAQNKPTYTNLKSTNDRKVLGIFTARTTVSLTKQRWAQNGSNYFKLIDQNSMKELYGGSITGGLLFCDDNPEYGINNPKDWYCP